MRARPQKGRLVFVVELRGATGHWRIGSIRSSGLIAHKTAAAAKAKGWRHGYAVTDARVRSGRLIMERAR